jgi:tetratricopeptide (TPR) repeat protein
MMSCSVKSKAAILAFGVMMRRGALDEAIVHFTRATEMKPGFDRAHFNFGVAWYEKGNLEQAIAQWRETAAIKPGLRRSLPPDGSCAGQTRKARRSCRVFPAGTGTRSHAH